MHLFYSPDINSDQYTLSSEESRHCIKVLRLKTGDTVHLTDGRGTLYETIITNDHPKKCGLQVVRQNFQQKGKVKIHIAVAPTKNISRFEWFLEKATEIGISEITPLICENSERRVIKTGRLEKVIIAAMKQSLKVYLPQLNEARTFDDFIRQDQPLEKFIAYCSEDYREGLKNKAVRGKDSLVLVGPEGDFSPPEIKAALTRGFYPVSLGNSRLRTETAALVACHTLQLINE